MGCAFLWFGEVLYRIGDSVISLAGWTMRIDYYLKHLIRHDAQGVEFVSGTPVRFYFPSGPQDGRTPVDHREVRTMVEELMPVAERGALLRDRRAQVTHTLESSTFEITIDVSDDERWRVSVFHGGAMPAARSKSAPPRHDSVPTAESSREEVDRRARLSGGTGTRSVDDLLREMVHAGASDLHLCPGVKPMIRLHGHMQPLTTNASALDPDALRTMLLDVTPPRNRDHFEETSDTDFAYELGDVARFRVNLFEERCGTGAVFRQIPMRIQTLDELGLPQSMSELCGLSKGLVLVTGPTGSGKSTTLAALVDHINRTRAEHIITIEDPIEFVHPNRRCLVNQREVGVHTASFKVALRAALREDPDIVLVGELRDLETVSIALETAETGHLVFGTLHTTSARGTVDRIVDQFPAGQQAQIRTMLAETLRGVIAQVLCRRKGGKGRVAAHEILRSTPALSNLIREGKTYQITTVLQTGKALGMHTMNEHLQELVSSGTISTDEALLKSNDRQQLKESLTSAGFLKRTPPS